MKECLEIALQAPNGGMREGWHWIVVTDPQVRAQIGEFYRRSAEPYLASAAAADPGRAPAAGSWPGWPAAAHTWPGTWARYRSW